MILQMLTLALASLGSVGVATSGEAFLSPLTRAAVQEESLHSAMRSMMADDGADDYGRAVGHSGLLQTGTGSQATAESEYLEDSARSLSEAVGPRWVGEELEADAEKKTAALLEGIGGHKTLGSLNRLLNAVR